jgi:hypothetical protein
MHRIGPFDLHTGYLLVSWDLSKMTIDMVHHLRRATIRKCPFCVGHRFLPNAERALGLLADEMELVEVYSPFSLVVISACGSGLFPPLNFTPVTELRHVVDSVDSALQDILGGEVFEKSQMILCSRVLSFS